MDFTISLLVFLIVGFCLYLDKRVALTILIALSLFGGYSYFNRKLNLPDDNFLEELLEDKIEKELGIKIDLTPKSVENANN